MNTMQQEFDAVVQHLYTQGKPALADLGDGVPACAYRGDGGSMCAVGCRIPDAAYRLAFENKSARQLAEEHHDVLPEEIYAYTDMFASLQTTHDSKFSRKQDGSFDFVELEKRLRTVALEYGLVFNKPQTDDGK